VSDSKGPPSTSETSSPPTAPDPLELLRSRSYLALLVFGGLVGVLAAFVAYFFLEAVAKAQRYVFQTLPHELGFSHEPAWWPLPWPPA
jgi:hypothetical protein